MPDIVGPNALQPIVDENGVMTQTFQAWTEQITKLFVIEGVGSPEGVIIADVGREYRDSTGIAEAIKYTKRDDNIADDRSKGWILI